MAVESFRAGLMAAAEGKKDPPADQPEPKAEEAPVEEVEQPPEGEEREVEEEEEEEVEPSAEDEVAKAAAAALAKGKPPEKKVWKGKIKNKVKGADGKETVEEEEVEVDEEELALIVARRRSLDRAAFSWSEKLAESEKKLLAREQALKDDPFAVMREAGHDPFRASLAYLKNQVDMASMSPEQQQQMALQLEREAVAKEREQLDSEKAKEKRETQKTAYRERVLRELPVAMDKRGLMKHPLVMSLINEIGTAQMFAERADFPDLDRAADETESLLQETTAAWLGNLAEKNPAALLKALPPAVIKAIRSQALVSAQKNPTRPAPAIGTSPSAPRQPVRPRREPQSTQTNPQEWRRRMQAGARRG